ncbi:MAG: cytochrome c oxidase subunit I [Gemmataceae bacterium]
MSSSNGQDLRADLDRTWRRRPGFFGWLTSTNHKDIGLRFIITAFIFFLLAGILAVFMRLQLAVPRNTLLGPDLYNQFFTTHGTTMMFLFAVPVMEGMGLYLVPLMVGTRNVAFPRLLNFSYYVYLCAGFLLYVSLILNIGPDMGWFSYVPLAGPQYAPGRRMDVWSQMVTLVEISSLSGAVDIIVTALKLRAPGMSLNRVPLFVWTQVITSFMIIFAMPSVMLCSTMLSADRMTHLNTHFYNPAEGGDALLWQHMFWFFAHPEVYIIFLPATGFIAEIIPTFTRRRMFGYTPLVLSAIATAFIGFGVWVHHMFATPLPQIGQGLFTASSLMIVIPNAIQVFCWTATICGGWPRLELPMAFVLGFFANFLIGGLTGVMLASVSIDLQVHDTFFVVAHLHYVLIGGAIFPLFGAFYFWYPKWTGRMLNSGLGWLNFWLFFIGFNLTFFPMHQLGLKGMTRRVYTYAAETGWGTLNMLATIGTGVLGLGVLVFIINAIWSRRNGRIAGDNPWEAATLEWTTASPVPSYNFDYPPTVHGRYAAWENTADTPVVTGLSLHAREVLVTTIHDAAPDHRYHMAGDTIWPFVAALATGGAFTGFVFHPIAAPIGPAVVLLLLAIWFWPGAETKPIHHPSTPDQQRAAARGTAIPRAQEVQR